MASVHCARCAELGFRSAQDCPAFEQHVWRSGLCRNCAHSKTCAIHQHQHDADGSTSPPDSARLGFNGHCFSWPSFSSPLATLIQDSKDKKSADKGGLARAEDIRPKLNKVIASFLNEDNKAKKESSKRKKESKDAQSPQKRASKKGKSKGGTAREKEIRRVLKGAKAEDIPRRCLSDPNISSKMMSSPKARNYVEQVKYVDVNPSVLKKGRSSVSPRPQMVTIIPEEGKVQLVNPRIHPEVVEIKVAESPSQENESSKNYASHRHPSSRRTKTRGRSSSPSKRDSKTDKKTEKKKTEEKEKKKKTEKEEKKRKEEKKKKKTEKEETEKMGAKKKVERDTTEECGSNHGARKPQSDLDEASMEPLDTKGQSGSSVSSDITTDEDSSNGVSAGITRPTSFDGSLLSRASNDDISSPHGPFKTVHSSKSQEVYTSPRQFNHHSSITYLRCEVDRLLGQAQEAEKALIKHRSDIARLKLEKEQWKSEALSLRQELQALRERCAAMEAEMSKSKSGTTTTTITTSSGVAAAMINSTNNTSQNNSVANNSSSHSLSVSESSAVKRSPLHANSGGSHSSCVPMQRSKSELKPQPPKRPPNSTKPVIGRMVELRHVETKEERERKEREKEGTTVSDAPKLKQEQASPSVVDASKQSKQQQKQQDEIFISAPLTPPAPPAPNELSVIPQAQPKFQRLLKDAARRMSSNEYRKSQTVKGGETRMLQQLEMRENVVREILTTERNYKSCLAALINEYQHPLKEAIAQNPQDWQITPELIKVLFCQVEVVMNFTTVLLEKLENKIDSWNPQTSTIGDVFIQMSAFMKVYRTYIMSYQSAHNLLKKLSKEDKKFAEFLEQANLRINKQKQFFGYDMESLLITPVQRVPRYICLLRSLHQYTNPDHEDYALIAEAIKRVELVAQENNKSHAENISIKKLLSLQEMFNAQNINIVEPNRRYVHEGVAWIARVAKGKVLKEHKKRYLLLFSDMLLVGKVKEKKSRKVTVASKEGPDVPTQTPELQFLYQMDLAGMKVFKDKLELFLPNQTDDFQAQNAFLVVNNEMTCFIYVATSQEKQKWVEIINTTLVEHSEDYKHQGAMGLRAARHTMLKRKSKTSKEVEKAKEEEKERGEDKEENDQPAPHKEQEAKKSSSE